MESPTLAVIIVNYNVKNFLKQCLHSVFSASKHIETEVFVVDNASVDGSVEMLRENFPQVKLIANAVNVGFSKANNQAIRLSSASYVLLLNPDTIVQDDTFEKCIGFMNKTSDAGGLGVKMIDGKGKFLPESKRGLPSPAVSFYKISGLSSLFPKSKIFGQYHQGFLDEDKNHVVDILSGAFMLIRKSVLDKVGLLDENFFMYGEDIDLSYRIVLGGYKNYYFSETKIIHYKGESTKKGSLNYVLIFYKAMYLFAQKHFSSKQSFLLSFLIQVAIWGRACMAGIFRVILRIALPLTEVLLFYAGFYFLQLFWANAYFRVPDYFSPVYMERVVPSYVILWYLGLFITKSYQVPFVWKRILKGIGLGTLFILIIYALSPAYLHFSRTLIVMGAAMAVGVSLSIRWIFSKVSKRYHFLTKANKNYLIIGVKTELERISTVLNQRGVSSERVYTLAYNNAKNEVVETQLLEKIRLFKIEELIFCSQDLSYSQIIHLIGRTKAQIIDYKIVLPGDSTFIGSKSFDFE